MRSTTTLNHMERLALAALPDAARALLARGAVASYVLALYPPRDRDIIRDRFVAALVKPEGRSVTQVETLLGLIDNEIDRYELGRHTNRLWVEMTGDWEGKQNYFNTTPHVLTAIGPRVGPDWRGRHMDGDIYAYLVRNAALMAQVLVEQKSAHRLDREMQEALLMQMRFWSAVQRIIAAEK